MERRDLVVGRTFILRGGHVECVAIGAENKGVIGVCLNDLAVDHERNGQLI